MRRPAGRDCQVWATLALVLLALTSLFSCAKHVPRLKTVVFWVSWPVSAVEPLAKRFEDENPSIRVLLVQQPWSSITDSLAAAVKAGAPPDLCQLHDSQLPPWMAGNSLSDWSAGVADLRAGLRGWDMCMVGDAIYGLPWLVRTQVLFYNKALLARAGAGADAEHGPVTWDELRSAATRVERLGKDVHGYGMATGPSADPLALLLPFAQDPQGEQADTVATRQGAPRFSVRLDVLTLETLQSLREVSLAASQDTLEQEFVAGRLGMVLASSNLTVRLAHAAPALRYGMALVPEPAAPGSAHVAVAGGEVLVSFTGSHRKEDALKLGRFLVRAENAHGLATALQIVQPATLGADTTAWYRARPEQQIMFKQYATARFIPNFRERVALTDTLRTLLEDVMTGSRSAVHVAALADSFITRHLGQQ